MLLLKETVGVKSDNGVLPTSPKIDHCLIEISNFAIQFWVKLANECLFRILIRQSSFDLLSFTIALPILIKLFNLIFEVVNEFAESIGIFNLIIISLHFELFKNSPNEFKISFAYLV